MSPRQKPVAKDVPKSAQLKRHKTPVTSSVATVPTPISHVNNLSTEMPHSAKLIDQWRTPNRDFQRDMLSHFKIPPSEELSFLAHWAKRPFSSGIIARDDTGTLVFAIDSTDVSDLEELKFGRSDSPSSETQWLHVYDDEGLSWLTQFRCADSENFPAKMFDTLGRPMLANGRIGYLGFSGLTVSDFIQKECRTSCKI